MHFGWADSRIDCQSCRTDNQHRKSATASCGQPLATIKTNSEAMNKLTLILVFGLIVCNAVGQKYSLDSLRFAYCEYDSVNGITVFPENALSNDFDIIITGINKEEIENIPMIEISWFSSYIDGTYCFVVTPRQMYLRSHHNNPNPNYLHWLTKSDSLSYKLIKTHFNNSKQFESVNIQNRLGQFYSFTNHLDENYVNDNWENKMYENLNYLILEVNEAIKHTDKMIELPSEKQLWQTSVRLLIDRQEYDSQIKLIKLEQTPDSLIILEE